MVYQREIRYYASIPKLFVLLVGSLMFVAIGWWAWTTQHTTRDAIVGVLGLGFGGVCSLVFLYWLACMVIFRKPLLAFTDAGVHSSFPLQPWRTIFVPWAQIERMGIFAQKMLHHASYYFVVNARTIDSSRVSTSRVARMASTMYPSLARAAIAVQVNSVYLFASRQRRVDMLERIKATFASEIIRYQIDLAMEEQPL